MSRIVFGRLVSTLALAATALVACGSDPEDRSRPPNLAPIDSTTTTPVGPPAEVGRLGLTVSSPDLAAGNTLSSEQAVEAPVLSISGVPAGTVALAVVALDTDRQRTHWIVSGLDPSTTTVDAAALPDGAVEYQNESGEYGWLPVAEAPARIRMSVLALDATVVPTPEDPDIARPALEAVAIDEASILVRVGVDG